MCSSPIIHTLNYLHRKYPNPFATHVHSVDTLSRTVDPVTGIIRSERIIGVQQGAPKWITKVSFILARHVAAIPTCVLSYHVSRVEDQKLKQQLFSLPPTAFVREIVFINPETTTDGEKKGPTATMMSVNLSLAQYM